MIAKGPAHWGIRSVTGAKPHGQPGNLQVGDMDENPLDSRTPKKKTGSTQPP